MKIVIAGAGSVGRTVALELLEHGHEVTLIDRSSDQMRVASVADADWVLADACSPDALAESGVADADVLVAATGDDKANLVISLLAKTEFAVPRVVARLNNPKNEWLFDGSWGIDVLVSTPKIMTALVEEAVSVGILVELFNFNGSDHSLFALTLPNNCPIVGQPYNSVALPAGVSISATLRGGQPIHVDGDALLNAGDEVILLMPSEDEATHKAVLAVFTHTAEDSED